MRYTPGSLFVCNGVEEAVSRILYPQHLSMLWAAIIYLGRQLPDASSNQPEG
jgi:hypothetical protein